MAPGDPLRADLPAFRTLALLGERLPPCTRWGPTGSAGFELATGWPTMTEASDLDLLVRCPEPLSRAEARAWVAACSGLPARCDLQLDTGRGGVALAEWAAGRVEVLVKTDEGPQLVGDPWSGAP
jgi:phosphoribosyl-dephospho-CoA transferase